MRLQGLARIVSARAARGVAWVSVAAVALGCASAPLPQPALPVESSRERPDRQGVAPSRAAPPPRAAAPERAAPSRSSGSISPEPPPGMCDLPDTAVEAPLFASSDANLRERGTQILDDVIACLKAGLLGDRSLLVVGYSDPRGAALLNDAIALERARAVRRYLIRRGVRPERIVIASRGEREALGEAPESWLYDRRVEIRLLPGPDVVR